MLRDEILAFLQSHPLAVLSSVAADGSPQSAVMGVVVTSRLEVFFDTWTSSRKCANMRRDARVSLAWWEGLRTVQYEGIADEPQGEELELYLPAYLASFPEGRERRAQPGLTYFRVRPTFVRWSDFSTKPPRIEVLTT